MKNKIILFSGKAGTGKSTCARYLQSLVKDDDLPVTAIIFSFAEGVKETAIRAFDWDGIKGERGRKLLQDIGKTGRAYDIDIWVKQMYDSYSWHVNDLIKPLWGIVDDWRFPNEYNYLEDWADADVIAIRIDDPAHEILKGTPAYEDESETALDDFTRYDYVIRDAPDVEALKVEVQKIYNDLKKEI